MPATPVDAARAVATIHLPAPMSLAGDLMSTFARHHPHAVMSDFTNEYDADGKQTAIVLREPPTTTGPVDLAVALGPDVAAALQAAARACRDDERATEDVRDRAADLADADLRRPQPAHVAVAAVSVVAWALDRAHGPGNDYLGVDASAWADARSAAVAAARGEA